MADRWPIGAGCVDERAGHMRAPDVAVLKRPGRGSLAEAGAEDGRTVGVRHRGAPAAALLMSEQAGGSPQTAERLQLLLDSYLPDYDVTEFHAGIVDADLTRTWNAIRHADLSAIGLVRALLLLRSAPGRLSALAGGRPPPPRPPLRLDDMPLAGFKLLEERPHEIAFGFVGRPWKVGAEQPLTIGRSEFAAFSDPGYAKVAFTIRAQPHGANRTLVSTETRTATTDPDSRRRFAAYWRLIGPISALMRRLILRSVKSRVERPATTPRTDAHPDAASHG